MKRPLHTLTQYLYCLGLVLMGPNLAAKQACEITLSYHPAQQVHSIQSALSGDSYQYNNTRGLHDLFEVFNFPKKYVVGEKKILIAGGGVGILSIQLAQQSLYAVDSVDIIDYQTEFREKIQSQPVLVKPAFNGQGYQLDFADNRLIKQFFALARTLGTVPHQFDVFSARFSSEEEARNFMGDTVELTLAKLLEKQTELDLAFFVAPVDHFLRETQEKYDIIIDMEGAMAYSTDRLQLARVYQKALKEDGLLFVSSSGFDTSFIRDPETQESMSFSHLIRQRHPETFVPGNAGARSFALTKPFPEFFQQGFNIKSTELPVPGDGLNIYPVITYSSD